MKIGILGTGNVGKALGEGFTAVGHEVRMGSRNPENETLRAWAEATKVAIGTAAEAVAFGEIVALGLPGEAVEDVLRGVGPESFRGKLVVDATNPVESTDGALRLAIAGHDSGGERIQRLLPDAQVVKAFNTVGYGLMFRPELPGGPPDMFIAGDDAEAKAKVGAILDEFGWGVVDLGGIECSRYLEAMCMAWILAAIRGGNRDVAFKLLRK